jgi:DNA-binding transcriptional ArsR family regulator
MNDLSYYKLFFKALSNKTRFEIIKLLVNDSQNVSEICSKLGYEQSRVSHALSCLYDCGFVEYEWIKGKKHYSLDKELVLPILNIIDDHIHRYREKLLSCKVLQKEKVRKQLRVLEHQIG